MTMQQNFAPSNHQIVLVNIANIQVGCTVEHDEKLMTVCQDDLKHCAWKGVTLFGDSYHLGHKPVRKVVFTTTA